MSNWPISKFVEYDKNPRKNDHAVETVAAAIKEFGFRVPIIALSDGTIVDGHLLDICVKRWEDFTGQTATLEEI